MKAFNVSGPTVKIDAASASEGASIDKYSSVCRIYNAGPDLAFMSFSGSADTTGVPIPAGVIEVLSKGVEDTVSAVCPTGYATVYITPGEGL